MSPLRQVVVPLPDEAGRAAILAVHMRGVPLARELDPVAVCELISKMTRGAHPSGDVLMWLQDRGPCTISLWHVIHTLPTELQPGHRDHTCLSFGLYISHAVWLAPVLCFGSNVRAATQAQAGARFAHECFVSAELLSSSPPDPKSAWT